MKRVKAFTLVEVIIALAVLVFGLFSVVNLQFNSQRAAARSHFKTRAFFIAQQRVEEMRAVGFDALHSHLVQNAVPLSQPLSYPENWQPGSEKKQLLWQVQLREDPNLPDCVEVRAVVKRSATDEELIQLVDYVSKQ